jgi:hypothetical protein
MGLFKLVPTVALVTGGAANHQAIEHQFDKIFNVANVTAVQVEVNDIAQMIYLDHIAGAEPQNQDEFVNYVRKNMQTKVGQTRDTSKDFWGTTYRYTRQPARFTVSSAGADLTFDTEDDIVTGFSF